MSHFVFPLTEREPINTSAGLCKIRNKEKKIKFQEFAQPCETYVKINEPQLQKTSDAKYRTWNYKQITEQSVFVIVEEL